MSRSWFLICFVLQTLLFISSSKAQNFQNNARDCYTPNRLLGTCINIRQCPALISLLQSRPLTQTAIQYLQQSQCGFEYSDPKVCCTFENSQIPSTTTTETPPFNTGSSRDTINARSNLLPTECGVEFARKIWGGERTGLDEFPWMALLEYQKPTGLTTACGGVLISDRYVLTAAHCLAGKDLPRSWVLRSVRLGEYDTSSDRDCVKETETTEKCAPPTVTVGVEETMVHENYRPTAREQSNDIALLRLSQPVTFTNYIKPVCLPSTTNIAQRNLWVVGWGKTENSSASDVKLKLRVPLNDPATCNARYSSAAVNLGPTQLCAGGEKGKDSCRGDSGGPLMAAEFSDDGSARWTTVGVVSFGPSPCGMQGWPGVYTKVAHFTDWILGKMRP